MAAQSVIDETYAISAGKFRRYHGDSRLKRLLDIKTNFLNTRDAFRVASGFIQSYLLLKRLRPDGVFMRGGFVSLPVCKMAKRLGIPYVTHESDAVPSLTNKLLADGAAVLATGMPKEFYSYPPERTIFTGIPITDKFQPVDREAQTAFKQELGIAAESPVVFITGGGLGAHRLNVAVVSVLEGLVAAFPTIVIIHQVGQGNMAVYDGVASDIMSHVRAEEFIKDLYKYSGAADVVITRAGATAVAEMAAQHKTCIVVPNPQLTDGHQTKNAEQWAKNHMAVVITESQLKNSGEALLQTLKELLGNREEREKYGKALGTLARPDAAGELADVLITTFTRKEQGK